MTRRTALALTALALLGPPARGGPTTPATRTKVQTWDIRWSRIRVVTRGKFVAKLGDGCVVIRGLGPTGLIETHTFTPSWTAPGSMTYETWLEGVSCMCGPISNYAGGTPASGFEVTSREAPAGDKP